MFSYYGSKSKIVDYYPPPKYGKIIEPFAGSARYSLKYWDRDVLLVDKYDVIIRIWNYLKSCSPKDIISLYIPKLRETINKNQYDCEESFLFMSFVIKSGTHAPAYTVCKNRGGDGQIYDILKRISKNVWKIKEWKIQKDSYDNIDNMECTWFIDPPYQYGGKHYIESNKNINFKTLSDWCKSRQGQVIVCENIKADWMPFKPIIDMRGTKFKTTEVIWSNYETNYDFIQQRLF